MNKAYSRIILASSSPRRQRLLEQIGLRFSVQSVDIDESSIEEETPKHRVIRLAAEKSLRGKELAQEKLPIIGADTEVVVDDQVWLWNAYRGQTKLGPCLN